MNSLISLSGFCTKYIYATQIELTQTEIMIFVNIQIWNMVQMYR